MHPPDVINELKKNQDAYNLISSKMEADHWGKTVLLHDGEVVGVYNDAGDAYSIACEKYGLGRFSLHQVGEQPVDLGFHTPSLHSGE